MKNVSSDNEPAMSDNNKIKCPPPEGKLMPTLRRVLVVFSFLQGVRRAIQVAGQLAKVIKEWLDPS